MTEENNTQPEVVENDTQTNEAMDDIIPVPPIVFLLFSLASFLVMIVAGLLFGFNIVFWGGLVFGVIGLLGWAFLFPEAVIDLIRGRNLQFGGVGVVVTGILIVASVLVYNAVESQGLSRDLSERDVFSLDTEVRDLLQAMGNDETIPTVELLGFYSASDGSQRDRISVLLQDMVNNSGGKIRGYQFIDPALEPLRTQNYLGDNPRIPSIVVAQIDPATGEPSETTYEIAAPDNIGFIAAGQFQIINAMLSLSVDGDFRAYVLDVVGGLDTTGASGNDANGIINDIDDEWTVETITPLSLPNPSIVLNDPSAGAEVIIIAGGTQPLTDEEVAVLTQYVQDGGDLIVLADINTEGGQATALADNFSALLWDNFGVRFRDDLVIDPAQPVRQNGRVFLVDNYGTHPIVAGLNPALNQLVMSSPRSIEIADTPPATVTVTPLVSTSNQGYAKTDLDFTTDLTEADLAFTDGDLDGQIPLAVAVENETTGSRLVLFGSPDLMRNEWRTYINIEAPEVAESAIFWVSNAQSFSSDVRQLVPEPPEADQPIFVNQGQLGWMSFVVIGIIPFGMLLLGALVWYVRRPTHSN